MPLLTGGSLAAAQRHPAQDPRATARLVAEVAAAVHHAHQRGILHRDLKPANILLDDAGRPHVTDFGLAKRLRGGNDLTETGAIMGSPGYMAPEQASGDPAAVTTACDVYGVGAILYALLTGRAPFEGSSVHETIARLHDQPAEPPSRINRAVPRPLDQICLMALEKDPARRYATAEALAADLRRWLAGEAVLAQPEPLTERTRRWMRRRRTAVAAAAAAMLVALVGLATVLAVLGWAHRDLSAAHLRERARFDLAVEAIRSFHTGVAEDLLLREPQFQSLRTRLLQEAREFFGKLETLLQDQRDPRSRRSLGQAYEELASLTQEIGSKVAALDLYRRGLAIRRELARDRQADILARSDVARCLLALGTLEFQTGHPDQAMSSYEEAQLLLEEITQGPKALRNFRADLANCEHRMGDLLAATGQPGKALEWYQKGRSLRAAMERTRPDVAECRASLAESDIAIGTLLWGQGQPAAAIASFRNARAVYENLARQNPASAKVRRQLAQCYNAIGYPLHAIGKTDDALKSFGSARAILEALVRDYPAVIEFRQELAYSYTQIGTLLCDSARPNEARAPYENARVLLEALHQANPTVAEIGNNRARCYSQIGQVLSTIGKPLEALAYAQQARAIREALIEANPSITGYQSDLAVTVGNIGVLKREARQFAEAATSFREAIALLERLPSRTPEDYYNLACYHARLAGLAGAAGSGIAAGDARIEADRAMKRLHHAASSGFRILSLMAIDRDLDALRSRPDFRLLFWDLSFPDVPFAQ
jgi:tetratricopeptide (TPR) repeat protein